MKLDSPFTLGEIKNFLHLLQLKELGYNVEKIKLIIYLCMDKYFEIQSFIFCLYLFFSPFSIYGQANKPIDQQVETDRTNAYATQLEDYLSHYLVDQYGERSADAWHRDYSSIDAFKHSRPLISHRLCRLWRGKGLRP